MAAMTTFHRELQGAVNEQHQADHPLIAKWARGEVKRETVTGAAAEIWHWVGNLLPEAFFNICAKSPADVVDMEMENLREETDPDNPHTELLLRFNEACGTDRKVLMAGRGLPTTESWLNWELDVTRYQSWIAAVSGVHISSEAQEPTLINKILPALRETYKFNEHELEFWWLHGEADIEHGGRAFKALERHCKTRAQKDLAIHYAREGARMKWLFWDGINLHYEMGYKLQ